MKAIPGPRSFSSFFLGVRIYRDDLERILELLRNADLSIIMSDDSFEYESLEDLQKAKGNTPRALKIEGRNSRGLGGLSLTLSKRAWYLESYFEQNYAVAREIEDLLKARRTRLADLPYNAIIAISIIISGIGVGITFTVSVPVGLTVSVLSLLIATPAVAARCYSYFRHGIVLNYRHEASFFSRNRDKILLLLCGAIFGAIMTGLLWFVISKPV